MKKILLISSLSLIAFVSELSIANNSDDGHFNLSLSLGNPNVEQTLTATASSDFSTTVELAAGDHNGQRILLDKPLTGNIAFEGRNLPPTNPTSLAISKCQIKFIGINDDNTSYFKLLNADSGDKIAYYLQADASLNGATAASVNILSNWTKSVNSEAQIGSLLNKCDIDLSNITVKSVQESLSGKTGDYSDLITYTLTVI